MRGVLRADLRYERRKAEGERGVQPLELSKRQKVRNGERERQKARSESATRVHCT